MLETKEDLLEGSGDIGKWRLWQREIEAAQSYRKRFDKEVKEYNEIYSNEAEGAEYTNRRYPIFWANTQTLKPLTFSNLPLADIRRRYAAKDAIARLSSILLERGANFFMEKGNLQDRLSQCRDDSLITGMGVLKVRLNNVIVQTETFGEQQAGKTVEYDFIPYQDYLSSPAKFEALVRWRAYRHKWIREELIDMFGKEKGMKVRLSETILEPARGERHEEEEQLFKRAEVWEIWDKQTGKVIFWSQGYAEGLLSEEDESYNLETFFPSPAPINMGRVNNSILPVPPYRMYKAQAEELNEISDRIEKITEQIKAGGLYNAVIAQEDIESHLNNDDGEYSPTTLDPSININNLIYNKDVKALADVLAVLRSQKQEVINEIRDITGISDIVRGTSVASETATAQKIKGNFAISRIQTQQEEMTRFIRDVIRISSELIAENFTGKELAEIANMRVLEEAEFNQKLNRLIVSQGLQGQDAEDAKRVMREEQDRTIKLDMAVMDSTLKAVEKLLRNDKLRGYSIDVESETTVQVNSDKLKAQRIEFVNVISGFIQQYAPLVQGGLLPRESFSAMLGFVSRPFKVGRELEEAFELMGEEPPEEKQTQEPSKEIIDAQLKSRELDIKEFKVQSDLQVDQGKLEISKGELALDAAKLDAQQFDKEADREAGFQSEELRALARNAKFSKEAQEAIQ